MAFVKQIDESQGNSDDATYSEPERKKHKKNPKQNGDSGASVSPKK